MGRLRTILSKPFPECLEVLPSGQFLVAAFYLFAAGLLHYIFIYALATGKIRGRISTGWIEARDSAPISYWIYVAGFGAAVLFLDGILIYVVIRQRRNRQ